MAYTANTPQGNQQVATTQPLILGNFQFINTDLQVEHSFNGNAPGVAEGVHLRASMPGQATPIALPTGTKGIYYISNTVPGQPKFYDGTNAFNIQVAIQVQRQIISPPGGIVLNTVTPTLLFTAPTFSYGTFFVAFAADPTANYFYGDFFSNGTNVIASIITKSPGIIVGPGLPPTLQIGGLVSSSIGAYNFTVIYFTP